MYRLFHMDARVPSGAATLIYQGLNTRVVQPDARTRGERAHTHTPVVKSAGDSQRMQFPVPEQKPGISLFDIPGTRCVSNQKSSRGFLSPPACANYLVTMVTTYLMRVGGFIIFNGRLRIHPKVSHRGNDHLTHSLSRALCLLSLPGHEDALWFAPEKETCLLLPA